MDINSIQIIIIIGVISHQAKEKSQTTRNPSVLNQFQFQLKKRNQQKLHQAKQLAELAKGMKIADLMYIIL